MTDSKIIMCTTEDGLTKIETTFGQETVWLTLDQMAELFQRNKSMISRHISNIFREGELIQPSVVAKSATTAADGSTRPVSTMTPERKHSSLSSSRSGKDALGGPSSHRCGNRL